MATKYTQLLLLADVENHGRMGDIIKVRRGFARNYLIPQEKGCLVTAATLRRKEKLAETRALQAQADRTKAEAIAAALEGKLFSINERVDETGQLYGSVTAMDLMKLLAHHGFEVEKKQIVLSHSIKSVGLYAIELRLDEGVRCQFDLEIRGDHEEFPEELMHQRSSENDAH